MRRRSLSKLRRRLSQTFRRSFGGSLADLGVQTFTIDEHEDEHSASLVGVSMNTGDGDSMVRSSSEQRRSVSEAKINGINFNTKSFKPNFIYSMDKFFEVHYFEIISFLLKVTIVDQAVLEEVRVEDFLYCQVLGFAP